MDKPSLVKLPKDDFETLEKSKALGGFWKQKVLQLHLDHKLSFGISFETLLQALVNGYEVEESKEEKVRKVLLDYCNGIPVSNWVINSIQQIYEGVNE